MPRERDAETIEKIRRILQKNPNGLWMREIARRTKLPKSTVHRYINEFMKNEIEEVLSGGNGFVKIIRLKR